MPLDGSACAAQALPLALPLAHATGATLLLLTVLPEWTELITRTGLTHPGLWARLEEQERQSVTALEAAAGALQAADLPVQTRIRRGAPAAVILETSRDADVVVMSTHGRSGWPRVWCGSVAAQVLAQTTQPILLVRSAVAGLVERAPQAQSASVGGGRR